VNSAITRGTGRHQVRAHLRHRAALGVQVVADAHVLVFHLYTPDRLTEAALNALLEAENTDGTVVCTATLADLTFKRWPPYSWPPRSK
jgi:hypothetical protein